MRESKVAQTAARCLAWPRLHKQAVEFKDETIFTYSTVNFIDLPAGPASRVWCLPTSKVWMRLRLLRHHEGRGLRL